ncbi:MAG: SdrD B-like domain-containing protein [Saprospiraceae bacterium]
MKSLLFFKGIAISLFIFCAIFPTEMLQGQTCNNATDGGIICCDQSSNISPYDPDPLYNIQEASGGGNTAIEYMWMYTTDPFNTTISTWNAAMNSNSPNYDPGPVVKTTFYVRCARRAGCVDFIRESNVIVVSIANCDNLTTGGKIGDNQVGCGSPFTPATLNSTIPASGGSSTAPIQYSWFKSNVFEIFNTASGNWTMISNATGESYNPAAITDTTYYVRVARRNGCATWYASNIIKITVLPGTNTSEITSQPFCIGGTEGSIRLTVTSGTAPFSIKWSDPLVPLNTQILNNLKAGTYSYTVTDANGCTVAKSVEIKDPSPIQIVTIGNDITCRGKSDGDAVVQVSGGTAPYSFLWSNTSTTATISNLSPGRYSITVTDALGCKVASVTSVQEPQSPLTLSTSFISPKCNAEAGSATVQAFGGTFPYFYLWSNGETSQSITNVSAGNYSVTVTDSNNCGSVATITITQPDVLTITLTSNDIDCNGNKNGSAVALVSGGTIPYRFSWSNGETTSTIVNLPAGFYTVTVLDANDCQQSRSIFIAEPDPLNIAISSTNISCNGDLTGSVFASVLSGGAVPFSFLWSNGSTSSNQINVLGAGTYTVTVTDSKGCSGVASTTVTEFTALTISVTSTDIKCNGDQSGSASVTAIGGTGSYSYIWSNGANSSSISSLAAGTYSITVTDSNGCSKSASVSIVQPSGYSIQVFKQDIKCFGGNTGIAGVVLSGSPTGVVSYLWSNGQTNATISNLSAGLYKVTVSDSNSCQIIESVQINEPQPLFVIANASSVKCQGDNSGSVVVNVIGGGSAPYSYLWSNGSTDSSQNGTLAAGIYSVTVTDANACTAISSAVVNDASKLTLNVSSKNISCKGVQDGSAAVSASGGTGIYAYFWSTGATTASIGNLVADTYYVTVTDSNGCTEVASVTINPAPGYEIQVSLGQISCHNGTNGTASVFISGSPNGNLTFNWSNGQTGSSLNNLGAGIYSVTATDQNGCTAKTDFVLSNPSEINFTINTTNIVCGGINTGSATVVNLSGGQPPYAYSWSNGGNSASIGNLAEGTYTVTVTDARGCTEAKAIVITSINSIICQATITSFVTTYNGNQASAAATASGGQQPYTFKWTNGATSASISNLTAGAYGVVVTDANGCTCTSVVKIGNKSQMGNFVWEDKNGDGVQQGNEPGIADIKVTLSGNMSSGNPVILTQQTDANGYYLFNGLMAGRYKLTFEAPLGYSSTAQDSGSDDLDSDVNPNTGMTGNYDLADGESNLTIDAGYTKLVRLGDKVWFDKNKNGVQDNGESGFANITVKLYLPGTDNVFRTADDVLVATTTTDNFGMYYFNNVLPGFKYKIQLDRNTVPSGYEFTTADVGLNDSTDSGFDVDGYSHVIMVMQNQSDDFTIDAGLFTPCNNVDEGGLIGPKEQTICGPGIVSNFMSFIPASGGSTAPIEYLWMKSTSNPFFVPNSTDWVPIIGSNVETYVPGLVTTTTYFIRCARRQGCDPYTAESNIVTVFVTPLPKAEITNYPRIDACALVTLDFSAADAGTGATYNWNFGTGAVPQQSAGISTSMLYNSTGLFRVSMTVTKSGCSATAYANVNVVLCPGVNARFAFVDFKLTSVGTEKVALNWKTSDARYDNLFIVEHSKDGVNFDKIAHVNAVDNLYSGFYTFDDFQPAMGHNFYRIRHIDFFGGSLHTNKLNNYLAFSAPIKVAVVYPNPATDVIKIEVAKSSGPNVNVEIVDIYGQVLMSSKIAYGQVIKEMDLSTLQVGTYFVKIDFGNDRTETHKIIVQEK